MEPTNKQKRIWIAIGVFMFLAGTIQFALRYYNKKKIIDCVKIQSTCNVYETNYLFVKTSGLWVYYTYYVDGMLYRNRTNLGVGYVYEFKEAILNKEFPVVYCKDRPGVSNILVVPDQFKDFGIVFPDSLNWVNLFKKGGG